MFNEEGKKIVDIVFREGMNADKTNRRISEESIDLIKNISNSFSN